jgi:GntR family transcriptional repressor for pyruvate dehydrogenase complex
MSNPPSPLLPDAPTADVPTTTRAIDAVFETLLADILRGTHAPGKRLPAERELARQLGASRPTLREALRRLGEWHMVEPRRGSGVVVRPMREWSLDVLPAYLRYATPGSGRPTSARILLDVVTMRRALLTSVVLMIGDRAEGASLEPARAALARAWASRRDPATFPRNDLDVLRCVIEACGLMPGMWLLNQVSAVYLDVVRYLGPASLPSDDYLDAYSAMIAALERGDAKSAAAALDGWFEKTDRGVVAALQGMS